MLIRGRGRIISNIHTSRSTPAGIYDQSASADLLLAQPPLYAVGREAQLYRSHSFWVNIIDALYQSTVIFFVAYCVRSASILSRRGC